MKSISVLRKQFTFFTLFFVCRAVSPWRTATGAWVCMEAAGPQEPDGSRCFHSRDGDRKPVQTSLSIAVNQSKTGPPSKRFGFLCMHRVPGGVIKLSAPISSLASQCLPSATIKQPFQNLSSLVPCRLSLCSEAF